MTRRLAIGAVLLLGLVGLGADWQRLRHLAVPVWAAEPRPPAAPRRPILDGPERAVRALGRLPARVTALLRAHDGALYVGTFDQGVFRIGSGGAAPLGVLEGRERFVNALVEHEGTVVAGTYRGAIALAPDGTRRATFLRGRAVEGLLIDGDQLLLGTERGVFRADGREVLTHGVLGEPIRATALARSAGRLWVGSPDGVWSIAWPFAGAPPSWHPLVFGEPGADTNVVTALVPVSGGVLAGTDDGGVVRVTAAGARAVRFSERRADEINPGALARLGNDVWAGTQGAGLLCLSAEAAELRAARPAAWRAREVSAVASDGASLLVGAATGDVWAVTP
jgi:ligand-binding sensor domain-containing protein